MADGIVHVENVDEHPKENELSVDRFIETALNKDLDIEKLKQLIMLKREVDKDMAKKAFDEAMSKFQSKCPIIKKTREVKNKDGKVLYKFAPIESIMMQNVSETDRRTVKELITDCGFSYMIETKSEETGLLVTCVITHKDGHSKLSEIKLPLITQTSMMSDAQQMIGTRTMGMRIAFSDAFGIMTIDEDMESVSTVLQDKYGEIVSHYKYHNYVDSIEVQIETAKAYKQFLATIPSAESADELTEILKSGKFNEVKTWEVFQGQNINTVKDFLSKLRTGLQAQQTNTDKQGSTNLDKPKQSIS